VIPRRRTTAGALLLAVALVVTGCSNGDRSERAASHDRTSHADHSAHDGVTAAPVAGKPLRPGERLVRMQMAEPYKPSAPYGRGTDDYRCFVLDPHLDSNAFITGLNILPGQKKIVHHVILFQVPPSKLAAVRAKDRSEKGEGWTCFGGPEVATNQALDNAGWLGAWAPGGGEQVMPNDVGIPLQKGSRVIMQVHYNLLAGSEPDVSSAQLRLAPASKKLAPLHTMLLPAPVELPCRPAHDQGPLCDRRASVEDAQKRFGSDVGLAADYLHILCGKVEPGPVQTCDREVHQPVTVRAAAGHMHLLGRSISITANPGTSRERTLLDIPVWDFDNQGAKPVKPVHLKRGDTLRVTCRHDQAIRDVLPAFDGTQEKYVVWGEGTTDEMCLGLLLATRD
jgi:hypothetical protein